MPIQSADIQYRYATTDGTSGNTRAGQAASSLGGFISTTGLVDAQLENLFPEVTGDENALQNVDYKCMFVINTHPTLELQRSVVWLISEIASGADTTIALDGKGVQMADAGAMQSAVIPNKDTRPDGTTPFIAPRTKAEGLAIGDIGPGQCIAIWVRRQARNTGAQDADGVTIRVEGDTAA